MSRWIVAEERPRGIGTWPPVLWLILAALPWALLLFLVVRYGLDLPIVDEWTYLPIIERSFTGTLDLGQLWAQYAEHRPIFPLLVMLFFVHATGWNIHYELVVTVLVATIFFFVLTRMFRRALPERERRPPWLCALLSLVVFSLCQWEVWLWGAQIQMFLNVLGVSAGILMLTRRQLEGKDLALAALFGVLATYSFGNGLLFWPLGLVLVAFARQERRTRWRLLLAWLLVSAAVIGSYFYRFQSQGGSATLASVLNDPVHYLRYFLTYIGSPLASFGGSAFPPRDTGLGALVGAAGCVLLIAATRRAIRVFGSAERVLPFLALAGYAVGSGLLATRSRFHFGVPQAYASRYTTTSSLFWIGTIGIAALLVAERDRFAGWFRPSLGGIAVLVAVGSLTSIHEFPGRKAILLPARDEMLRGDNWELLKRLHPDEQVVRSGLVLLRRLRLSVFRDAPPVAETSPPGPRRLTRFGQILEPLFRPEAVRAGRPVTIPVRVTNPTIEDWPAGSTSTPLAVNLSYHWIDLGGRPIVLDGQRTHLPHDLKSGETAAVIAEIVPPTVPGRYVLRLTMVQEGVTWFDLLAGGAVDLSIETVP
jgi:hypothetical protein